MLFRSVQDALVLKARAFLTNTWSALTEAKFSVRSPIEISEIMYHPVGDGAISADEFEFLELFNAGSASVDLSNWYFSEGINFVFPAGSSLKPNARLVLVRNRDQFLKRYPGAAVFGVYTGKLSDNGETLRLNRPDGSRAFSTTYGDSSAWPQTPDGWGFSLTRVSFEPGKDSEPSSWREIGRAHV